MWRGVVTQSPGNFRAAGWRPLAASTPARAVPARESLSQRRQEKGRTMDSKRALAATSGTERASQPSGAYWAARLIECQRVERALEDGCAQLRDRLDAQEERLAAIAEALARTNVRPLARGGRGRQPMRHEDGAGRGGGAMPGGLRDEMKRQAKELAMLQEQLQRERATAEGLARQWAELSRRLPGETASAEAEAREASLREQVARQAEAISQLGEAVRAERRAREELQEQLAHVAHVLSRADVRPQLEGQRAELQVLSESLKREAAARAHAETTAQQAHAALQRRVADHSALLRSVSGAMDRELAARRDEQSATEELRRWVEGQLAEQLSEIRGVATALEQEVTNRAGAAIHLERAQAVLAERAMSDVAAMAAAADRGWSKRYDAVERRLADEGGARRILAEGLERESADRKRADAEVERAVARLDRRIAEQVAAMQTLERDTAESQSRGASLQQRQAALEQRVEEQTAAARALGTAVEEEAAERKAIGTVLERVQAKLDRAQLDQQVAELAAAVRSLEREMAERKRAAASLEQLHSEIDQRIGECAGGLRRAGSLIAQEVVARENLERELSGVERVQGELRREIVLQQTGLRAVNPAPELEIDGGGTAPAAMRRLEALRPQSSGSGGEPAPAAAEKVGCREVAIRPARMLALIEGDAERGVAATDRHATVGAVTRIIGSTRRDFERKVRMVLRDYLERSQ